MHLNYNHFFFFTLLLITIFMLITVPFPVEGVDVGRGINNGFAKSKNFFNKHIKFW
uniref:Uncharacterized protein n=1 Tax=Meloidogyne enterolobii TaxID=390850 RepID=A0A6V7TTF5_MELEN|nr:unnamed protein product [Meloidogyne enterolobii]